MGLTTTIAGCVFRIGESTHQAIGGLGGPVEACTLAATEDGLDVHDLHGDFAGASCRLCGCTEDHACEGGCCWVYDPAHGDLCSTCLDERVFSALQRHLMGMATDADVDLLHRFAETGPYSSPSNPAVAQVAIPA